MKPSVVVSWFVILAITVALPVLGSIRNHRESRLASTRPAPTTGATPDLPTRITNNVQMGMSKFAPANQKTGMLDAVDDAAKTPVQIIMSAITAGELVGKDAAIERLRKVAGSPDARAFEARYANGTPLPAELTERYGFSGRVAAAFGKPAGDPDRDAVDRLETAIAVGAIGGVIILCLGGLVGFGLFITAIVMLSLGSLRLGQPPPVGPAHTYVEAFAVYLGLFVAGGIGVGLMFPDAPLPVHAVPVAMAVVMGGSGLCCAVRALTSCARTGAFTAARTSF